MTTTPTAVGVDSVSQSQPGCAEAEPQLLASGGSAAVLMVPCPKCGEHFRMAWIGNDPPEPYGEVCGCPDENYEEARAEKRASDREAFGRLIFRGET